MKIEIEKAVSYKEVKKVTVEVNIPDEAVYYEWNDNGIFFAEGLILFAFIPRYKNAHVYDLIQVMQNKQDYTDFHPTSDCKDSYFLDHKGLRNRALDILTNINTDFKLISEDDFNEKRIKLLDYYKKEE